MMRIQLTVAWWLVLPIVFFLIPAAVDRAVWWRWTFWRLYRYGRELFMRRCVGYVQDPAFPNRGVRCRQLVSLRALYCPACLERRRRGLDVTGARS